MDPSLVSFTFSQTRVKGHLGIPCTHTLTQTHTHTWRELNPVPFLQAKCCALDDRHLIYIPLQFPWQYVFVWVYVRLSSGVFFIYLPMLPRHEEFVTGGMLLGVQ